MSSATHNIDQLVATYAARGRQQLQQSRRARLRKGLRTGGAVLATALLGIGLARIDWPALTPTSAALSQRPAAADAELREARQLNAALAQEIDRVEFQRAELQRQRSLLHEQQQSLGADIAALDEQQSRLQALQSAMAEEQARLDAVRERLAARQQDLGSAQQHVETEGPRLQAALDELRQQRQDLDDERKRFRAQRQLLEHEISLLNEQRTALQDQQQRLQDEWESLQHLMEQAANLRRKRNEPPATGAPLDSSPDEGIHTADTDELLAASDRSVADGELGEIRGGFDIGGKLDISIGLSRSVAINGAEQYSSSLRFNGAQAVSYDQLAAMTPVVIQNGDGNTAETPALGAWSGGLPVVIQNTLDNQHIINANVLDVTISNVASRAAGISAETAVSDSLAFQK